MPHPDAERDLHHNVVVHFWDAGFFGLGIGMASLVTVLPLFVRHLTDSNLLIGLVVAMLPLGWHLPQLAVARRAARVGRLLPTALAMSLNERLPYAGLALVAWLAPSTDPRLVLGLAFGLVLWFGVGGGLAAPPFRMLVAKLVPSSRRGAFYGMKAGSANLFAGAGAVVAGVLLGRLAWPFGFVACFLGAFAAMMASWALLALTREPRVEVASRADGPSLRAELGLLLRSDPNLRGLLLARSLSQFALMAQGFIAVHATRRQGLTPAQLGLMTGVFMASQTLANPLMGWLGDRWRHRWVMAAGALAAWAAAALAVFVPTMAGTALVFALTGVAAVAVVITPLAMVLEYSPEASRPVYIGLSNTLTAPAAIGAPLLGGWLADAFGFDATFVAAAVGGVATALVLVYALPDRDPVTGPRPRTMPDA